MSLLNGLYPREAGELQVLLRRHGIATGHPEDIAALPPRLSASSALEEDLLAFINTSRNRAGGPISMSATLHLLLTTIGGPGAGDLGPEYDEPTSLLSSFLEAMGGWPELSFAPFDNELPATHAAAFESTSASHSAEPTRAPRRSIAASLATQAGLGDTPWTATSSNPPGASSAVILEALARLESSSAQTSARLDALAERLAAFDLRLNQKAPSTDEASPVESASRIADPAPAPPSPAQSSPRVDPVAQRPDPPPLAPVDAPPALTSELVPSPSAGEAIPSAPASPATQHTALEPLPDLAPPSAPPSIPQEVPEARSWSSALLQTSPSRPPGAASATTWPVPVERPSAPPASAPVPLEATYPVQGADHLAPFAAAPRPASPGQEAIAAWSELFAYPPKARRSAALIPFAVLALMLVLLGIGVFVFFHFHNSGAEPAIGSGSAPQTSSTAGGGVDAAPPLPEKSASSPDLPASPNPGAPSGTTNRVLGARETFQPRQRAETPGQPTFVAASTMESRLAYAPRPQHPHVAGSTGLSGMVVMEVIVDQDGNVSDLHVLGGQHTLRDAAVNAVRTWRYHPVLRDGRAIPVRTIVRLDFNSSNG